MIENHTMNNKACLIDKQVEELKRVALLAIGLLRKSL